MLPVSDAESVTRALRPSAGRRTPRGSDLFRIWVAAQEIQQGK